MPSPTVQIEVSYDAIAEGGFVPSDIRPSLTLRQRQALLQVGAGLGEAGIHEAGSIEHAIGLVATLIADAIEEA